MHSAAGKADFSAPVKMTLGTQSLPTGWPSSADGMNIFLILISHD